MHDKIKYMIEILKKLDEEINMSNNNKHIIFREGCNNLLKECKLLTEYSKKISFWY